MKYFAYGSNMLTKRLTERVPSAKFVGCATVSGRELKFHKKSSDESGKCDIPVSRDNNSVVYGVLFDISDGESDTLDKCEGVGAGYERVSIEVLIDFETIVAETYLATAGYIDDQLTPYDWYHRLVVEGALEHNLPDEYIRLIESVTWKDDSDCGRSARRKALDLLGPNS